MVWARKGSLDNKDAPATSLQCIKVCRKVEIREMLRSRVQTVEIVPSIINFSNTKPMCLQEEEQHIPILQTLAGINTCCDSSVQTTINLVALSRLQMLC
jgi:hypothetical protein